MDSAFLTRLDDSERQWLKEVESAKYDERFHYITLVKSDVIRKTLESGNQVYTGSNSQILPNTIPFSDRVFVEICPSCKCVHSPNLLKPYLERDLVIPVLNSKYDEYSPNFIELLLAYPHMSNVEFYGIRNLALANTSSIPLASRNEISAMRDACLSSVNVTHLDDFQNDIRSIFVDLMPFYSSDIEILLQLMNGINKKDKSNIERIYWLSVLIGRFRSSQVYPLTPQIRIPEFEILNRIPEEYQGLNFNLSDVRNALMSGLKISYDSTIPLETYLDIVTERKGAIRQVVKKIMEQIDPENPAYLSALKVEIERINTEVRSLGKSSKGYTTELFTNFVAQNKGSILTGLITTASLGLMGMGVVGCGAGALSGLATKAVSKISSASIPDSFNVLTGRMSAFLEPSYERFLSKTLSTNINVIQLWQIRKALAKNKKNMH